MRIGPRRGFHRQQQIKNNNNNKKNKREREAGSVGRNVGGDGEETDVKAPAATLTRKGEKEDGVGEEDGG